jgi:hypothetical protein
MDSVVSPGKTSPPAPPVPAPAVTADTARPAYTQTPLPDPLLTALSQLLGIYGNLKSEDALASGIPHERPLQPASFSRIAEANGCKVRIQPRAMARYRTCCCR